MKTQPDIANRLVRRAAAAAPPSLAERLEEEWLADLESRRGLVSRLLFGLGCCWAVQTITREFPLGSPVASAAGGGAAVASFGSHAAQRWQRRPGAMIVIVAFHLVLIYAFASIFRHVGSVHEPPIIHGKILPIVQPADPPLPKPKTTFVETHVDPLNFNDRLVFPTEQTNITFIGAPDVHAGGSVANVSRVPGGPGEGFPSAEEFYPPAAKRLGEQGVAAVHVCVDSAGRLTEIPTVLQSAGSARLDSGAIRLAQAGSGHYRPTKEDGRAVSSCYAFRVRFQLRE
jgi:TonB family protein